MFDSVTGGSAVVPTVVGEKVIVDVDSVAADVAEVVPVPVNDTVCVLGVAESVTVSVAVLVPVALGVNVTLMVQLAPTAKDRGSVPQVFVCAKFDAFEPLSAMLFTVSEAVPELVRVTLRAALVVPVTWLASVTLVGESVAADPLVVVPPVPVRVTVWVVGLALSVMVSVAVWMPVALGLNVTLIVQLDPAARLAGSVPQVLV